MQREKSETNPSFSEEATYATNSLSIVTRQKRGKAWMGDYLIGTGGWAYFRPPSLPPLVGYSRLFDFVEVNSTFYQIPSFMAVESWRRQVPPSFEFSVRCNRVVTHKYQFQLNTETQETFSRLVRICKTLRADILHVQTPPTFEPNRDNANQIRSFMSTINLQSIRIALEVRGGNQALTPDFVKMMQDHNMIHSVDLSKDEQPAYESDTLYSRLFGKGIHNIYQPTDQELETIDEKASAGKYTKAMVSFHFVRMYKDAARLKTYERTGKFPMVTKSTGLNSLEEVLGEDSVFPCQKQELIQHQGWKIIDLTKDKRVRASEVLEKLHERNYRSVDDVVETLERLTDFKNS